MQTSLKRRLFNFILILAFYVLLIFFFSSSSILYALLKGEGAKISVWEDFEWNAIRWLPWALFTPIIIRLVRKFQIVEGKWPISIPVHIIAMFAFSLFQTSIYYINSWVYYMNEPFSMHLLMFNFIKGMQYNVLTYWITIGVCYLFDYYRKSKERELRTYRLESQLTQAQLEVLKMQLHPHFLFNTLHAISALVYKKPKTADNMISRLSDLLRLSLESSGKQKVPLKEELEVLTIYLEIEKMRFQDRLNVKMDIQPRTLDALIPNFILQPLVENAIRHGISPRKQGGTIEIKTMLNEKRLLVHINDDGKGFPEANESNNRNGQGIGLANTKERLIQLYGDDHQLILRNGETGGHM